MKTAHTFPKVKSQLKSISQNLELYISQIEKSTEEALDEIAKDIMDKSLAICPVDTEELKNSNYIASARTADSYTVEIGYTDPKAPNIHENAGRNHDYKNPTTPNTHWQFLLTPATEVENDIAQIVADKIKGGLK
jgi:hypothetical protein